MPKPHNQWMRRCFELAAKGLGNAAPNPLVGSVIVAQNRIIGEGYHRAYGQSHAEVEAVRSCIDKTLLSEATLYVNLEPCAHQGKTPACAPMVVEMGIRKVVIANRDPFHQVDGKGIQILKAAGIEVTTGILEQEGAWLNRRFFQHTQKQLPWVILKWAQSADGFMAPADDPQGNVHWITRPETQALTHSWRAKEQAILVGAGTVLADNPSLDVRAVAGNNPLRVVLDHRSEVPKDARVFTLDANYLHVAHSHSPHANHVFIERDSNYLQSVLKELADRGIQSVIVEGGATVLQHFIAAGLWNEARILTGATNLGAGLAAPKLIGREIAHQNWGADTLSVRLPA